MTTSFDDTSFTLTSGAWSNTYPLEDLAKWLKFYRHQKERFPKSGPHYDASIAAIEALAEQLNIAA
ncbi:hypothetical protein [Paracoccus sp. (in: a-proteobacteria)]|uniref:hypothetical protein n=1 Tax=Paracoccus sp. TaxID=267 RepID=UPI0028999150|nr:hypothetical protein [Paracoccus sp. (in: a-proteobacteria)]